MSHTFTVNITTEPRLVLEALKSQVLSAGGKFSGDACNGEFSGSGVVGSYHVLGSVVTVIIKKKPFLAPMSMVESRIRSYFNVL